MSSKPHQDNPQPIPGKQPLGAWIAACLLVALICWGQHLRQNAAPVTVALRLASATAGPGQLYYRGNGPFEESLSHPLALRHDGKPHTYVASLPGNRSIKAIRVDVGTAAGSASIQSLRLSYRETATELSGAALAAAATRSNQLEIGPGDQGGLQLHSTGNDPYLEFSVPTSFVTAMRLGIAAGKLPSGLGLLGLAILAWRRRRGLLGYLRVPGNHRGTLLAAFCLLAAMLLFSALRSGCSGLCAPRSLGYGAALLSAALAFSIVGFAVLRLAGWRQVPGRPALFLALVTGQASLAFYVLVRSLLYAALLAFPITTAELFLVVAVASLYLLRPAARPGTVWRQWSRGRWLPIEIGLLGAACLVIADRELPRIVMLSSDPDTHAYFARQVELLGALPWRGDKVFGYPAGTGAFGYLWSRFALLDVRNAVAALPLLQAFTAALVIAEAMAIRVRRMKTVSLVFATALGVTVGGLLVPLYAPYAHMEGTGRQMGMAFLAVAALPLLPRQPARLRNAPAMAIVITLCLLSLAILNPINVVVPLALLAAYTLCAISQRQRLPWLALAPLALPPLLLLDPYYHALLLGAGTPESRFTVTATLQEIPLASLLEHWKRLLAQGPWQFALDFMRLLPGQRYPSFAFLLAACALPAAFQVARQPRRILPLAGICAFVFLSLWAADRLFATALNDRRFYLLQPYFGLSLGQLKILLVTTLAASAPVALAHLRAWKLALVSVGMVALVQVGMHLAQPMMEQPRAGYCGSLGCAADDDLNVLADVTRLWKERKLAPGYVLLPNSLHHARNEAWIFPVTGTRVLPFVDAPPPAFFYYQGRPEFTTANYMRHVCERFDRDWLRAHGIRYVFRPSSHEAACMTDIEDLPAMGKVVSRHGQSLFVELAE